MKIKEWFKTFFAGMAIGVSSSIPGVSGGTIAVILKVYERLLWSISNSNFIRCYCCDDSNNVFNG